MAGDVVHTYTLNGSQIVSEQRGNYFFVYQYDESGSPIAIQYRTKNSAIGVYYTYYLEKNLQGDIIALYNSSGTKLVGYTYDAWGNCITTYYNGGDSTGAKFNPFRYRGYYYDEDLGLYYLNSRYYDSRTGRFISPDDASVIGATPEALTDKNLYAYCDNNPVMREDGDGEFWHILAGGIIGGIVSATVSAVTQYITEGTIDWGKVGVNAASGVLNGVLSASGATLGALISINAATSALISVHNDMQCENISIGKVISNATISAGVSALFTYIGGSSNGKQLNAMYRANRSATKSILAGGMNPKLKAEAIDTVGTYFKSLGKYIVQNTRESFTSSSLSWGVTYSFQGVFARYGGW